ncbi:MAG TPA: septal ring lytic transglycosylase RlpA family protein [Planktothrix sp.]|jgi:rare lipoprotein A
MDVFRSSAFLLSFVAGFAVAAPSALAADAPERAAVEVEVATDAVVAGDEAAPLALAANTPELAEKDKSGQAKEVPASAQKAKGQSFSGNVSWYGLPFHGKKSASGRIFDMNKLTCAHRTLPFGTKVLVENPRTGQSVIVEVIDRGPYAKNRVMDLSREAARRAGVLLGGIAFLNCTVLAAK